MILGELLVRMGRLLHQPQDLSVAPPFAANAPPAGSIFRMNLRREFAANLTDNATCSACSADDGAQRTLGGVFFVQPLYLIADVNF